MMELDRMADMTKREIRKVFRDNDESAKWPVRGRFNATERAIRRVARQEREGGRLSSLEYAYALDRVLSDIVNHCF